MYDPTPGRWLTEDPIGFNAEDMDLYRNVGNSPTNAIDPTGLAAEPVERLLPKCVFKGTWTLSEMSQVSNATVAAVNELEDALSMLTDGWDDLKGLSQIPLIKTFDDKAGENKTTLEPRYLLLASTYYITIPIGPDPSGAATMEVPGGTYRQFYINKINAALAPFRRGDPFILVRDRSAVTEQGTAATTPVFFPESRGTTIYNEFFFQNNDPETPQTPDHQAWLIKHELGRRVGFEGDGNTFPRSDVGYWDETTDWLVEKYDQLNAPDTQWNNPDGGGGGDF